MTFLNRFNLVGLALLAVLGGPASFACGGQAILVPVDELVRDSALIAVVRVTEVTKVNVDTGAGREIHVYVARAVVERQVKPDRGGQPPEAITIVGSTVPRSSAVWRPIEKKRYLAFLNPEQGHYRYGYKVAFREVDAKQEVSWYEFKRGGRPMGPARLSLAKAVDRILAVQKSTKVRLGNGR